MQVVPVSDNTASVEFTVSNEEQIQMRLYRKVELMTKAKSFEF